MVNFGIAALVLIFNFSFAMANSRLSCEGLGESRNYSIIIESKELNGEVLEDVYLSYMSKRFFGKTLVLQVFDPITSYDHCKKEIQYNAQVQLDFSMSYQNHIGLFKCVETLNSCDN